MLDDATSGVGWTYSLPYIWLPTKICNYNCNGKPCLYCKPYLYLCIERKLIFEHATWHRCYMYMLHHWHPFIMNLCNIFQDKDTSFSAINSHRPITSPETYLTVFNYSVWDEIKQEVAPDSNSPWPYICYVWLSCECHIHETTFDLFVLLSSLWWMTPEWVIL